MKLKFSFHQCAVMVLSHAPVQPSILLFASLCFLPVSVGRRSGARRRYRTAGGGMLRPHRNSIIKFSVSQNETLPDQRVPLLHAAPNNKQTCPFVMPRRQKRIGMSPCRTPHREKYNCVPLLHAAPRNKHYIFTTACITISCINFCITIS